MSDTNIVMDHLRAALLATPKESTFLTYLIQMALIEGGTLSQGRVANQSIALDDEADPSRGTYPIASDPSYRAPAYAS
ncbi:MULTISPECIES: hypothetical protein [Rhizobium/Agrobacterium group]|jgi:hypothetical protein|uniref:Uncharacterized protein n=1 Tax=Rhizobium rhizogenes TaxID=359 RepID=A0AA92C5D9_RHIRH|nr:MULTISPECIES: hypothetical protein [Rhizobium/Agrobacterium group]KQM34910.1 hypothetical protein ASE62_01065 [Rhizobium sp. Leaf202]KQN87643.1 hypothetical protein ASF03_01220 [Rhizobium sp. Leaf68]KQR35218.1 hypothetical protein ASF91_01790 [Rhizobium sp. Leaf155]KQZ96987.1 hypothetical protein ASD74_07045 [Rhizobium sp. Root564]PVE64774.1 hypothetical protein DC415_13435 [Agrobacterium tumefaciens]PVE73912.1 hypothetical protein DCP16_13435 [Sphingomonas sp. TPD3009]